MPSFLQLIGRFIKPQDKLIILSLFIMTFLTSLLTVMQPLLLTKIVDEFQSKNNIVIYLGLAILSHIIARLTSEARWFLIGPLEGKVNNRIYVYYANKITQKNIQFLKQHNPGEISGQISYATNALYTILRNFLFSIVPLIMTVVLLLSTVSIYFGKIYFIILATSLIVYTIFLFKGSNYLDEKFKDYIKIAYKSYNILLDLLLNRNLLRLYNEENYEINKYKKSLEYNYKESVKQVSLRGWFGIIQAIIIIFSIVLTLFISGTDLNNNLLTVGNFILINTYLLQLLSPLESMGKIYREITSSLVGWKNLETTINSFPDMEFGEQEIDLSNGIEIEFKDVSFKYPDSERLILDNISFKLKPNSFIAIVGESGSGKSTITDLITRFYEPVSGEILFNGVNIKNLTRNCFHNCFSKASQVPQIITDSIENNLTFGKDVDYKIVAHNLGLTDFINKLPDGFDTKISLHDKRFSEGQLQRIALARSIIANKPILMLDEVTSALDKITEAKLFQNLKPYFINKTVLYITHKLNVTPEADLIMVFEHGKLVEVGKHEELIYRKGRYYNLKEL